MHWQLEVSVEKGKKEFQTSKANHFDLIHWPVEFL
jgi:hypothetical protein